MTTLGLGDVVGQNANWWGWPCTYPVEGNHKGCPYIWCQPPKILKATMNQELMDEYLQPNNV